MLKLNVIIKIYICGRTLKASRVQDKPNLNNVFESYLDCHDLQCLCSSLVYLERLQNNLFTMMRQFGPPTFFITFTSIKIL
jgi:hypothetical protein